MPRECRLPTNHRSSGVITATVVGLDTRWQTITDGSNPLTDQKVRGSNPFGRASFAIRVPDSAAKPCPRWPNAEYRAMSHCAPHRCCLDTDREQQRRPTSAHRNPSVSLRLSALAGFAVWMGAPASELCGDARRSSHGPPDRTRRSHERPCGAGSQQQRGNLADRRPTPDSCCSRAHAGQADISSRNCLTKPRGLLTPQSSGQADAVPVQTN